MQAPHVLIYPSGLTIQKLTVLLIFDKVKKEKKI